MSAVLQKFAAQADPGVVDEVRAIVASGGKQLPMAVHASMISPAGAGAFNAAQVEPCARRRDRPA
jgi:hypothetical protein